MKTCARCSTPRVPSEFGKDKGTKDGLRSWCRPCDRAYSKQRYDADPQKHRDQLARSYAKDPERRKKYLRDWRLRTLYDVTADWWDETLASQGGGCAICGAEDAGGGSKHEKRRLMVDHSHETGKARGLLCSACNLAIGSMKDSPERLEKAASYLRKHA